MRRDILIVTLFSVFFTISCSVNHPEVILLDEDILDITTDEDAEGTATDQEEDTIAEEDAESTVTDEDAEGTATDQEEDTIADDDAESTVANEDDDTVTDEDEDTMIDDDTELGGTGDDTDHLEENEWFYPNEEEVLIAHALGGIQSTTYTNSLDAFLFNYDKGYRWFEVDLYEIADGSLVCFHEGHDARVGAIDKKVKDMTVDEFEALKYDDTFSLISFKNLLRAVDEKEDVYIVTDTKYWEDSIMDAIVEDVNSINPELYERIIPQIYKTDDLEIIKNAEKENSSFGSLIFTLYTLSLASFPNESVLDFAEEMKIPMVTMPASNSDRTNEAFISELHDSGIYVFTHTINDLERVEELYLIGVDGLYTDFYFPSGN